MDEQLDKLMDVVLIDVGVDVWCATLDIDNELDNWYAGGDT